MIDMFTDISGLFVINNESGWYEAWMIHDIRVPAISEPSPDGRAKYGTMTPADAAWLKAMGTGNNLPGAFFTMDGTAPRFPSASDKFPDVQNNTVRFPVSGGTFNAHQQSDAHAYWEFNTGTNWVFPHYELPFTGGLPGTFEMGQVGIQSFVVPGPGPSFAMNDPRKYGDNPQNPRDPDRTEGANPSQLETRNRFIPSGLTLEVLLDVFVRTKSFEPGVMMPQRLFDAHEKEVARVDQNGDGVISFVEADPKATSDGQSNRRLYLPATAFNSFAITREINDGMLAPRFAPSQRAYVLSGDQILVTPNVEASIARDFDDR